MVGKKAVVLLSGGLDSAVTLAVARRGGYACSCLFFDYGQRHARERRAAAAVAAAAGCRLEVIRIRFPWKGSSLLDRRAALPQDLGARLKSRIPSTYVPARNIVFLSFALSYAETIGAQGIFIGAHSQDYSGYPDCRPEFFRAFTGVIRSGTKAGVQGKAPRVIVPLLRMGKPSIIRLGVKLGADLRHTWSCYRGGGRPCGLCDSCRFRQKGFSEAGLRDPAL